jgi:biopolymer transport protein TolQ
LFVSAAFGQRVTAQSKTQEAASVVYESDVGSVSMFARAWNSGFIVFTVLLILMVLSVLSWGVSFAKFFYLRKLEGVGQGFVKSFWESRSLNDLNGRLGDYPYSPVREVFRIGYAELVRGTQLKDQNHAHNPVIINAALDNLGRSLNKAKQIEKRKMERYLSLLAISASASPFIGLFGTVWGILTAFEKIASTGSASLAAVAPGISEALIATAFGLAAAIPAVIGYNVAAGRIRGLMVQIDGFSADFLNIVERYMVSDKSPKSATISQPQEQL